MAVRAEGGFIVSGRWPYNTGCHGARWTLVVALAAAGLRRPRGRIPHCCLVRSAELTILDDWFASGMAATGSNTVVAEGVRARAPRAVAARHGRGPIPGTAQQRSSLLQLPAGPGPDGERRGNAARHRPWRARGVLRTAARPRHHVHDVCGQVRRTRHAPPGRRGVARESTRPRHTCEAPRRFWTGIGAGRWRCSTGCGCVRTSATRRGSRGRRWTCCSMRAEPRRSRRTCRCSGSSATCRRSPTMPSCTPRRRSNCTAACCAV